MVHRRIHCIRSSKVHKETESLGCEQWRALLDGQGAERLGLLKGFCHLPVTAMSQNRSWPEAAALIVLDDGFSCFQHGRDDPGHFQNP